MTPKLLEIGDWVIEKIVLLRGHAANKIARFVVVSGVALCVEPFWSPYLAAFTKRHFDIEVSLNGAPWLGISLVVLGLVYHYMISKVAAGQLILENDQHLKHDQRLLEELEAIANHDAVRESLDWISTHDAHFTRHLVVLRSVACFLIAPENEFLETEVKKASLDYARQLNKLIGFIMKSFFVYPEIAKEDPEDWQYCLFPDHNFERGGSGSEDEIKFYYEKSQELTSLIGHVYEKQSVFVRFCKERLGRS